MRYNRHMRPENPFFGCMTINDLTNGKINDVSFGINLSTVFRPISPHHENFPEIF